MANATVELSCVKNIIRELGVPISHSSPLHYDNTDAIYLCANPIYHPCMKHVTLGYHFVREQVVVDTLKVQHIHTIDQLADALTKPLGQAHFLKLRSKIGVTDRSSILRGRIKENRQL